jgi:hypothetical protein
MENMRSLEITLSQKAFNSFVKELGANRIAFQAQVRTTVYFLEDSPKLQMAIQMVKERFGASSISISRF